MAHELAHANRHDTRWTLASRLLCALLWPQPLLWLLCRRLEQLAEDACDLAVLSHACPPRIYADCLLTLAERRPLSRRTSPLTAGLVPFRSQLARRIQHILTVKGNPPMPAVTRRLRFALPAAAVLAALGGTLLIAAPKEMETPGIVGLWTGNFKPNAEYDSTAIFGPQGNLAIVGEQGREVVYGHYALSRSALTVTLKRTVDNGRTTINLAEPQPLTLPYSIADGMLTIRSESGPFRIAKRVSAYPNGMTIEAVAAEQVAQQTPDSEAATPTPLTEAQLLAGLTPVQGPGIIVTLNDSQKLAPHIPAGFAPPNLIHDTDIAAVVNELKAAGAEAISVNGQRLVATSAIRCVGPTIFINYTPQAPPFVIKAIGDSKALQTAMELPSSITKQIRTYDPAMLSVQTAETLMLPACVDQIWPQYDTSAALSPLTKTDFFAGLTPVQGPGIIVTLNDSKLPPVPLPAGFASPSLIHDTDITSVVNELKASGAEAISVNGQRLVAISPIRSVGPAILINATPQAAPFVIKAIGNPKTLLSGVELPGGVTKSIRAYDPAMFTTKVSPEPLLLPAYPGTATPRYAKPAPENPQPVTAGKSTALTSTLHYFVPKTGTHHVWLFVTNDTGRHLVFQKDCPPGTQVAASIPTKGKTIVYRFYDYGKLIQSGLLTPANQQGSGKPVPVASITSLQAERDRVQKLLLPLYRNYDAAKVETAVLNAASVQAERQRTALGQANSTFAALQELDSQSARAQLTILRNNDAGLSQNNQPAKRQLSVLSARRKKLAQTLPPPLRQSFENKSSSNYRVRFFLGLQLTRYQVKQEAMAAQVSDIQRILKSLNAQISAAQAQ